jgi:hypothetical protein
VNDDPMERAEQLDQRGAAAAADLRTRAGARPVPAFDPEAGGSAGPPTSLPSRRLTPRRWTAIAAVLVLLAGGGWLVSRRDQGGDQGPTTSTTDLPAPFITTNPPDGYRFAGAGNLRAATDPVALAPLAVYGPSVTDPGLGVTYQPTFGLEEVTRGVRVDVPGHHARAFDDSGFGHHALIVQADKGAVLLASPTLDRAALVRIAATTSVESGRPRFDEGTLPDGWHRLGDVDDVMSISSPLGAMRGTSGEGWVAAYGKDKSFVSVWSGRGDDLTVHASDLFVTETEPIEVRGHDAVLGHYPLVTNQDLGDGWTLSWLESPGAVVRISGTDTTRAEILKFADGLEPQSQADWKDLVERTQLGEFLGIDDPAGTGDARRYEEAGRGRFADGTAWRLEIGVPTDSKSGKLPETRLHVAITADSSDGITGELNAGVGSSGDESVLSGIETEEIGGRRFAAGIVAGDAATSVEVRDANHARIATAALVSHAGNRAWVAELPAKASEVVALDASGHEVGRLTVDAAGDAPPPDLPGGSGSSSGSGTSGGSSGSKGSSGSSDSGSVTATSTVGG